MKPQTQFMILPGGITFPNLEDAKAALPNGGKVEQSSVERPELITATWTSRDGEEWNLATPIEDLIDCRE